MFDDAPTKPEEKVKEAKLRPGIDSPCSSDGKDELKLMDRKWPRGHTSSSSRDVSPWDDDGQEYRRREVSPGMSSERQAHYMRHGRRMNSCDEDYEYENDYKRSREHRRQQSGGGRGPWYHAPENWSPPEFEDDLDRRTFERSAYERSTYGPPFDKRDQQMMKNYRNYEKRKFYANYGRKNYSEFDDFGEGKKGSEPSFDTSPSTFNRSSSRDRSKPGREYFHQRERKSFDRDSNESYESGSGGGSRKVSKRNCREGCYGSMDLMRDDNPEGTRNRSVCYDFIFKYYQNLYSLEGWLSFLRLLLFRCDTRVLSL